MTPVCISGLENEIREQNAIWLKANPARLPDESLGDTIMYQDVFLKENVHFPALQR